MIELVNVSKYYPTDFGRHYIFRDVSLALPIDKSVGVLGPNGAGKSTFLRLIGGADIPSEGKILRSGRISPPMGLTPGLQASLTGGENARFAGRIYGLQRDEIADLIEYVRELANIGKYFDMPVGTYSAGMRQRVSFAINMSMNFDYYLFDEIGAGGDKDFRKSAEVMVKERLKTSKFIIASHRTDELLDICDSGIVIQNGSLTFYDDIKDALAAYGGEDEAPDRRARRSRRQAGETGETANLEAGSGSDTEGATSDSGGKRMTLRERRRLKLEEKLQQASAAESLPVESEVPVTGAETAGTDEERQTLRERRRLKLEERMQQASPDEPEAAAIEPEAPEPEVEPVATDEDRLALREQRRLRRELKKQQATAAEPEAAVEPEAPPPEAKPVAKGEDRRTLREQRRLRRELKKQQAASVEAVVEELAPSAPEADPPAEQDDRKARREQRRLRREIENASGSSEAAPESLPELPSTPAPSLPSPAAAPPVGTAPLAQRLRPPPFPMARPQAAITPAAPASVPPVHPAGLKSLLIQRALLRQERARMTAARATKLLLQHLEDQAGSGSAASRARAWLIGTAQQTAAMDAAQAREMLDSITAYQLADHPQPVSASHGSASATGNSFSTGRTRFVFGRAAPSLTNPD